MPYELPSCEIPRISFHQSHSELMHQLERFGIIAFIVSSRSFRSCNLVGSQHTEDVLLAVMGLFDCLNYDSGGCQSGNARCLARIVGGNPLEQQMAAMLDLLKCPRCSWCRVPITGHSSLGVRHGAAGWVKGRCLVSLAKVKPMHLVPRLCTGSI